MFTQKLFRLHWSNTVRERWLCCCHPSGSRSSVKPPWTHTHLQVCVCVCVCVQEPVSKSVCMCVTVLSVSQQTRPPALTMRGLWGGREVSVWTPGSAELSMALLQHPRHHRRTATALLMQPDSQGPTCTHMAVRMHANIHKADINCICPTNFSQVAYIVQLIPANELEYSIFHAWLKPANTFLA